MDHATRLTDHDDDALEAIRRQLDKEFASPSAAVQRPGARRTRGFIGKLALCCAATAAVAAIVIGILVANESRLRSEPTMARSPAPRAIAPSPPAAVTISTPIATPPTRIGATSRDSREPKAAAPALEPAPPVPALEPAPTTSGPRPSASALEPKPAAPAPQPRSVRAATPLPPPAKSPPRIVEAP